MPAREADIYKACLAAEFDAATALTLRLYGAEVLGFLVALHRDYDEADEAYSQFMSRLWAWMPRFEWKCSMRTWSYRLARSASGDVRRGAARARAHHVDFSSSSELAALAQRVRTETLSILRTERRSAFEELCDSLAEADRELLILRVARKLPWRDVAVVIAGENEALDERGLQQESARLRKRYQLLKEKLRELGKERGLL